jgi:VanZ family protein
MINKRINKRNVLHAIIILCLIINLAFIFGQSAKTPEKSTETSDKVGEIVGEVIPPETKPGAFIQINLRKIAHFVEFATLGLLSSLYVVFLGIEKRKVALSLLFSPLIALLDETLQIFSGRGSSVKDVWIDTLGFFAASVIFYTVYALTKIIIKKVNNYRQNQTE